MNINGTEIDFSKQRGYFFNMDCLEALKQMPDKSVSLAIVDPPYGAGFTEGGGCQGWFKKYHQSDESSQICQVEREREREKRRSRGTDLGADSTSTRPKSHYAFGIRKCRKSYEDRRNMGKEIRKKL